MLGKIIGIDGNIVVLKLSIDINKVPSIINYYVLFDDGNKKLVGEIVDIKDTNAYINLLGELINNEFIYGFTKKPSFSSVVKIIPEDEAKYIIGIPNYNENKDLYFGKSFIYPSVDVGIKINNFFGNHFAIFGSSGSGKSSSVARIFQNLFEKSNAAKNASILIFDAYGEYHNAFKDLNQKNSSINFKAYTTNVSDNNNEILRIPLWLMNVDDIALLLEANSKGQLLIIEKALKLVSVFARDESIVIKSKNDIIARALIEILQSGKSSTQIRDQIFSVLTYYNTRDLNLNSEIKEVGYTRTLKQCLLIDETGKIRDMELVINFINQFLSNDIELSLPDGSFAYSLKDLYSAFEFALISEGIFSSEKIFDEYNVIKIRLRSLLNSDYGRYFEYNTYLSKDDFITSILFTNDGRKAQIINFNINYIDDRLAKTITKIYCRLFFEYVKGLSNRASLPINIILEEAHRYVQNDIDFDIIGYNIFDRITKEGRKYGILLGLISQRPAELSSTALSQCSNFLIFKMLHPTDIDYIRKIIPNITEEIINKIKYLQPGICMAFGSGFKMPLLIKFSMPDPVTSSSSCDISGIWFS